MPIEYQMFINTKDTILEIKLYIYDTYLEINLYICNTYLEINHETNFVQKITIMEK